MGPQRDQKIAGCCPTAYLLLQHFEHQRHRHGAGAVRNNRQHALAVDLQFVGGGADDLADFVAASDRFVNPVPANHYAGSAYSLRKWVQSCIVAFPEERRRFVVAQKAKSGEHVPMSAFLSEDFLLTSETARRLYREHAETQPIFDYHTHLSAADIAV